MNTLIGGNANSVYLIVANLGSNSGEGLDFINGQSFLERFYSVYGMYLTALRLVRKLMFAAQILGTNVLASP